MKKKYAYDIEDHANKRLRMEGWAFGVYIIKRTYGGEDSWRWGHCDGCPSIDIRTYISLAASPGWEEYKGKPSPSETAKLTFPPREETPKITATGAEYHLIYNSSDSVNMCLMSTRSKAALSDILNRMCQDEEGDVLIEGHKFEVILGKRLKIRSRPKDIEFFIEEER